MVSTFTGETWTILDNSTQGGCLQNDAPECAQKRGGLLNVNESSTWRDQGLLKLGVNLPGYGGPYENGDFGFDLLGLGPLGSSSVNLKSQTIAGLASKDFFVGFLGVNPSPAYFRSVDEPETNILSSLKESNITQSLSFAYSAGARYRKSPSNVYAFSCSNPDRGQVGMLQEVYRLVVMTLLNSQQLKTYLSV